MKLSNQRITLVTGANKGLGFEIARQLGQQGHTVLVGARNAERGERAAATLHGEGLDAHFMLLNVTDDAMVAAVASTIGERFGKLDVLVNNASMGIDELPPSQLPIDSLRLTLETNVIGAVQLIQAMLPLLRQSDAARIVNMGSGLGSLTFTSDPNNNRSDYRILAYSASKAALHAVTVQFANELEDEGIKVNAADPGFAPTDMTGHQGSNSIEEGAVPAVRLATLAADGPTGGFYNIDGQTPW